MVDANKMKNVERSYYCHAPKIQYAECTELPINKLTSTTIQNINMHLKKKKKKEKKPFCEQC